jgi:hypothetical protein
LGKPGDSAHNPSMTNWDSAYSVHQLRLHHGLHQLILSHQLVLVDGVKISRVVPMLACLPKLFSRV